MHTRTGILTRLPVLGATAISLLLLVPPAAATADATHSSPWTRFCSQATRTLRTVSTTAVPSGAGERPATVRMVSLSPSGLAGLARQAPGSKLRGALRELHHHPIRDVALAHARQRAALATVTSALRSHCGITLSAATTTTTTTTAAPPSTEAPTTTEAPVVQDTTPATDPPPLHSDLGLPLPAAPPTTIVIIQPVQNPVSPGG